MKKNRQKEKQKNISLMLAFIAKTDKKLYNDITKLPTKKDK